ncbi:MAG: hypothetical protein K0S12_1501 [Bacteroidetes bacterium]|nr:hypothetical protein [Bacteroidota bacterium]
MPVIRHRKLLFIFVTLLFCRTAAGQVTVYTVNFNNGCASGCLLTAYGGGWTVVDNVGGTNGNAPNIWYVSCAENGVAPNGCGSGCGSDASMHIGANAGAGGDMGASYNETGAANATYRLARSPVINCTGYSGLTLMFDYIAYGSSSCTDDRAQVRLSTDGGTTWPVAYQYCLSGLCCGTCDGYTQGQWTLYSLVLPAVFDNNPNVRVGFHWRNNGNGSGTDPSVGIDDIRIVSATPLPLTLLEFECAKQNKSVKLKWTTSAEINFSRFDVQRSNDASSFKTIASVPGKGKDGKAIYELNDNSTPEDVVYYRLKMIDRDGSYTYSKIVSLNGDASAGNSLTLVSNSISDDLLKVVVNSPSEGLVTLNIFDTQGKLLKNLKNQKVKQGNNSLTVDVSSLSSAVYILKIHADGIKTPANSITEKFSKIQ